MKICPHCQKPIRDDIWLCPLCGGAVGAVASGAAPYAAGGPMPSVPVHDDSKALASLICGIIGVVLLPFIASIPARVHAKKVAGHAALRSDLRSQKS